METIGKSFPNEVSVNGKSYPRHIIVIAVSRSVGIRKHFSLKKVGLVLIQNYGYKISRRDAVIQHFIKLINEGLVIKEKPPKREPNYINIEKIEELGNRFSFENSRKSTQAVKRMIQILDSIGIDYEPEKKVVIQFSIHYRKEKLYLLDFYLPPPFNCVIEIDGGYHTEESQVKYDKIRDSEISGKGLGPTFRFRNEQVFDSNFDLLKEIFRNKKMKQKLKNISLFK